MTAVTFSPRGIGDTTGTEPIFTGGFYKIRLAATQTSGQWVLPAWSQPRQLTGSAVTEDLDANPTIPYELLMYVPNGGVTVGKLSGMLEVHEFRIVAGSGPVAWETLVQVDGPVGNALPTGTQAAINADLYAQMDAVSGGATTLAAVTGISTDGKTLIGGSNSFSTMRGLLGAAPTASPTFTTALTAANPTFTGTVTIPDGALAIADTSGLPAALAALAPLANPALTGTPTVPTATAGTNTTQAASTAFVLANAVSLASPAFTGTPTAPTATAGTNTTQLATTAFVLANGGAGLGSPAFTGTPTAPTAAAGTNTTQLATTAFVRANVGTYVNAIPGSIFRLVWAGGTPVRPSTRTDIFFDWEGPEPSPPIVSSGTAGMYEGDRRSVTAF